jgi:pathogenesis-related protein 1
MYKKVSITLIMASAIASILIVPWAALQRSHAQSDLANTILKIHNDERAAVGVPPLVWSDKLAADAKTWAEHLATLPLGPDGKPQLVHGSSGENLWSGTAGRYSTADKMQGWVNEKKNWHGGPITKWVTGEPVTGHYTQMVWRDTKDVGCATASSSHGWDYLVCRYSPLGNYLGQTPY